MNQKSRRTSPRSTGGRLRTSGQAPFGVAVPCPIRPRRTRWQLPAAYALKATCARADWPSGLRKRAAMPLAKIQSDILRLLAAHRDPESYVAGSTPLNVNAPRYSGDIDVFPDREERVARAVQEDSAVLQAKATICNGCAVNRPCMPPSPARAAIQRNSNGLLISTIAFSRRSATIPSAMGCIRLTLPPTRS